MTKSPSPAQRLLPLTAAVLAALTGAALAPAQASSHREAPFITSQPKVDGTDFYMFSSYEPGRTGYVTLIANYQPLQAPYGGPNYFQMDPNALYEIHIDNNGDAKEDLSFQFRFKNTLKGISLPIGGKNVAIPLIQAGGVSEPNAATLNVNETYTVDIVRGDRRSGTRTAITNAAGGSASFNKPVDNIGTKTIPDYAGYAAKHIYAVNIPGCTQPAKLFVGQRKEAFAVNLGTIFDLVNAPVAVITDPALINAVPNTIDDASVTTLALEVHKSCLTQGSEPVIGGWTTASLRQGLLLNPAPPKGHQTTGVPGGAWTQVSRLGMPLVNEVVIGLPDKDRFNSSKPKDDAQFADYVTNPTLPALLEIALALPGTAPKNIPRTDLVTAFLTGIKGVNQPANVVGAEMLRLNTSITPTAEATQHRLGVAGGDLAGFPNGRRPKDDVVDISLVAVMGGLCMLNGDGNTLALGADCKPSNVPLGATSLKLHDAVDQAVVPLLPAFPYLTTPAPGAR
ncbi:DUF4331 domain-containing protein [Aquabacterium sp.]|uniref:DUF4331 domain-containing protein n=1 Tax=Aquabacterium sp. TaxID=1872578 RepID=UPI002D093DD8|nr:DUF4331 domain-containing protein [Aquabacterium sp.]HSW07512.1 DUF4331 domain-containing protein [Aquabacterium sp.]